MSKILSAAIVLVLGALPAQAQSFNIDFELGTNPTPPPASFAGAAQSPGQWNSISSLPASGLLKLDGAATGVAVATSTHPSEAYFAGFNDPGTAGNDAALLDDFYADDTDQFHMTITGLEPGEYDVYTYWLAFPFNDCFVEVMGSPDGVQEVAGTWGGSYEAGLNYVLHHKSSADGTIDVRVQQTFPHGQTVIGTSGIQLVRTDDLHIGLAMCFGDGTGAACPCSNTGAPGRGCQNSAGTGGALLVATGTTSPDTVVLQSSGELPSSISIFLQGNASMTAAPYGDGLRCTGGTLKRLYTKTAVNGVVSAPQAGDPSITDRSAALGLPIPVGGRRYYQVYFRDGNPGFCPMPQGNSFNVSNAVRINW